MYTNKLPTPICRVDFYGQVIYLKRDDLFSSDLSGNKFRKLFFYLDRDLTSYKRIVSYGGVQSNAMLSIAALAYEKCIAFEYFTRYLPDSVKNSCSGNFHRALSLGMKHKVLAAANDEALRETLLLAYDFDDTLFIPQGGATQEARYGIELLSEEIKAFQLDESIEHLAVVTPSGTGTTALWLQQTLGDIPVFTTPVVGSLEYLQAQWRRLQKSGPFPTILKTEKQYRFAQPHAELFEHYEYFIKQGITFDLIYAPVMWQAIKEHRKALEHYTILYVHSGGVSGNITQKLRYQ